jgi:hypothetical protein
LTVEKEDNNHFLNKEIKSWKGFEYALREENRLLFSKMLSECQQNADYAKAANARGEHYSAESFFMALILQQQKMISQLIDRLAKSKELLL